MPRTMSELRTQREKDLETNRALGVIDWSSQERQSDRVYEVVDGYHKVPSGERDGRPQWLKLGPGHRFHPTVRQVESNALEGKARELNSSELAGIGRSKDTSKKIMTQGADIGIRALPMSETAKKVALDGGLTEDDFSGVTPARSDGAYTVEQVEELVASKANQAA